MSLREKGLTIPASTIRQWEQELEKLRADVAEKTRKIQLLTQRLDALALFDVDGERKTDQEKEGGSVEVRKDLLKLKPPALIVRVLQEYGPEMTLRDFRKRVAQVGYPAQRFGPEWRYLYTLLPRLVRQGKITKEGNRIAIKRNPVLPGTS
jgi:hypothetical protein